jgi:5-formyltetrahydrofolate cyclo-ligase
VEPTAVAAWRRAERQRLLALRLALAPAERRAKNPVIERHLRAALAAHPATVIGVYWPFRGEFDPRPLVEQLIAAGARTALPAVVDKKGPLEYRLWRPGDPLVAGVWDIPVPEARALAMPEVVLAPLVGFDRVCYRLGYGGGYFDRTLAASVPRPRAIGVGFEFSRIETIHPQAFDMPMDMIVTEAELRRRRMPWGC